jgi:hypothetical protein
MMHEARHLITSAGEKILNCVSYGVGFHGKVFSPLDHFSMDSSSLKATVASLAIGGAFICFCNYPSMVTMMNGLKNTELNY